MMSLMQVFENTDSGKIRIVEEEGKFLFSANDVAMALGYCTPRDAVARHCKGVVKRDTPTNEGIQQLSYIPEGDLYRLIVGSRLPLAEKFEKWVFDEILPAIRKDGVYATLEKSMN